MNIHIPWYSHGVMDEWTAENAVEEVKTISHHVMRLVPVPSLRASFCRRQLFTSTTHHNASPSISPGHESPFGASITPRDTIPAQLGVRDSALTRDCRAHHEFLTIHPPARKGFPPAHPRTPVCHGATCPRCHSEQGPEPSDSHSGQADGTDAQSPNTGSTSN